MGRGWKRIALDAGTAPVPYPTTVFQGTETNSQSEVIPGHQRQCSQDADMDGTNRHADPEVSANEIQLRLVAFQSGRSAATTAVHLQRLVGMAQHSSGRTASCKEPLRTITNATDVVAGSWTAAKRQEVKLTNGSALSHQPPRQKENSLIET